MIVDIRSQVSEDDKNNSVETSNSEILQPEQSVLVRQIVSIGDERTLRQNCAVETSVCVCVCVRHSADVGGALIAHSCLAQCANLTYWNLTCLQIPTQNPFLPNTVLISDVNTRISLRRSKWMWQWVPVTACHCLFVLFLTVKFQEFSQLPLLSSANYVTFRFVLFTASSEVTNGFACVSRVWRFYLQAKV